nr:trace amine-associated receptor 13c-like [Pocillopora verrucosa]
MASSPECITWMVVGLTESVTIIALNSLTVIAFCRDRDLRKRSTYLVMSLAVADMLSGGISPLHLFYDVGAMCNFWRHNTEHWYLIPTVLVSWFLGCSLTNMTFISLERLNATFWPFRHRTIKKSVYWVLIIAIWLTALLFSCALVMIYYYTREWDYCFYTWSSFISIYLLVICVSYVFIFVKLRFGKQPRHHGAANRERKLTVTLFTVTSLSLLLWLPYVITISLFFATNILSSMSEMALFRLYHISTVLLYTNSFLNPIVYTIRMPGFRRALKMLCRQRPQPHRQVENIPLREINPQIWI